MNVTSDFGLKKNKKVEPINRINVFKFFMIY